MFVRGKVYRRRALHQKYSGQRQGGISTPAKHDLIFLFSSPRGKNYGYEDGWSDTGLYLYTGEGQREDMTFTRGNLAIRDHMESGKDLHLFEQTTRGYVRYVGQMVCVGYHESPGPDITGRERRRIVFELVPLRRLTAETLEPDVDPSLWRESLAELRDRALATARAPTPTQRLANVYERSKAIRVYVLKRANGVCEACKTPAPFKTPSGTPYLEVHHITRLSDGGPDHPKYVIALCPNCHRRAHYSSDRREFNARLAQVVARIENKTREAKLEGLNSPGSAISWALEPQYVKTILHAAKIYTELSGVMPSTTIQGLESSLGYLHKGEYLPFSQKWASTEQMGSDLFTWVKNPKTRAYGLCILWHRLGFLRRKSASQYQLSRDGNALADKYFDRKTDSWDRQYRSFVLERLLGLEGINVLISFLYDHPEATKEDVVNMLGEEMRHHSRVLVPLKVMRRGRHPLVAKPFNEPVSQMLLRILGRLGVVERERGRFSLSPLMEAWVKRVYRQYDRTLDKFVWTAPGERLLLASIAEVVSRSDQAVKIVSPYLDTRAMDLLERAGLLQDREFRLISRDPRGSTQRAIEKLEEAANLSVRFLPTERYLPEGKPKAYPLHAKMILSDSREAGLVTSANLLYTSLVRNYEVGILTYDPAKNYQLDDLFQTMWEGAIPL